MSFAPVIDALAIPSDARVDQRIPKKLLLEQGAPTAADKRQIQDGIEEMLWIAALKPTNIGVPEYRDETREYLEIAVLTVSLREAAKAPRLTELIHRAIPYPVVLVTQQAAAVSLSLAHKRWSQGESGKVVIEELHGTTPLHPNAPQPEDTAFFASLALSSQPDRDLLTLYQGWIDRVAALHAARITGSFTTPESSERSAQIRNDLQTHTRLQAEIAALRAQAAKEKQLARRVEINLKLQQLQRELEATTHQLRAQNPNNFNST